MLSAECVYAQGTVVVCVCVCVPSGMVCVSVCMCLLARMLSRYYIPRTGSRTENKKD